MGDGTDSCLAELKIFNHVLTGGDYDMNGIKTLRISALEI
jgi:hypothetical protein